MHEATLSVTLLNHTPMPEEMCAMSARLCYSKADIQELKHKVSQTDQSRFLGIIMDSGHHSVLEHVSFTFGVEGVSRALLAQLTRHRLASFSVQSQRYVNYEEGVGYILPPNIRALGQEAVDRYAAQMEQMQTWYGEWCQLLEKGEAGQEDARFVLPNACETKLVLTMNVRELLHFFSLRTCLRAQWEIRAMADEMMTLCKEAAPALFAKAGPGCVTGPCPEGKKTCGRIQEVRAKYRTPEDRRTS